jgi:hypothetical protein
MASVRLPNVGADLNAWGTILDSWLRSVTPICVTDQAYGGGAAGDGTTDDTAAINAAISAAATAGGGVVLFPPGTYKTTGALTIGGDNIILRGSGWDTVIKPAAGSNFDVIATPVPGTAGTSGFIRNYIGVENLVIDQSNMNGNGTTTGQGNGIHWYGTRYSRIDNVFVNKSPNWAVLIDGDNTAPGFNFGYDNLVTRCVFDICNAGCYMIGSEACDFVENRFKWAGTATNAQQPANTANGGQDTNALHLRLGGGMAYVAGNIFGKGGTYTTEAIRCSNSAPYRIIGNRFDGVRNAAIKMNAGNAMFAYNQLSSPNQVGLGFGVQIGSSNNAVIGNTFDTVAGAIAYSYAIGEAGGPFTGNRISGNYLLAGTSGTISQNAGSANQIDHNPGYNPVGKIGSPPAVPASGSAATNTTGVDCFVFVTCGAGVSVSAISVGGQAYPNPGTVSASATSTAIRVPAGQTITLTYAGGTPTWTWFGD